MIVELTVLSTAFIMGATIPTKYTCSGADVSPPLSWSKAPEGTQSMAILCDDPDAPIGDWVHWLLFNLPADTTQLSEALPKISKLDNGTIQGMNDSRSTGYSGPCPPPGKPHRYFFKVYALDTKLSVTTSAKKRDLLKAMEGHILAKGELMGKFGR